MDEVSKESEVPKDSEETKDIEEFTIAGVKTSVDLNALTDEEVEAMTTEQIKELKDNIKLVKQVALERYNSACDELTDAEKMVKVRANRRMKADLIKIKNVLTNYVMPALLYIGIAALVGKAFNLF